MVLEEKGTKIGIFLHDGIPQSGKGAVSPSFYP
jgi:hypothetical protein